MTEIKTKIPAEMEPAAVGGMVTDSKYVIDREQNKTQAQINTETDERINTEKTRAEGVEGGLNTRLQTVEQLAEISVGGGDIGIGTAADFESDDPEDLAKVPTVGAMLGGANDGVYDISARHSGTKYADLAAALGTNGANVPVGVRRGGMSVKFVLSSDNKYVQFRCMSDEFTTDVTQWQGMDDEPTAGSENLVKSGGVYGTLENKAEVSHYNLYDESRKVIGVLNSSGKVTTQGSGGNFRTSPFIEIKGNTSYCVRYATHTANNVYCWYDANQSLLSYNVTTSNNDTYILTSPSDAKYIRISTYGSTLGDAVSESSVVVPYKSYTKTLLNNDTDLNTNQLNQINTTFGNLTENVPQITTNKENIEALQQGMTLKADVHSLNLYDESKKVTGLLNYSNGVLNSYNTGFRTSPYIEVKGNTKYYINYATRGDSNVICWYDSNKQNISGSGEQKSAKDFVVTSPQTAAYLRISMYGNANGTMVAESDAAIDYVPYGEKYVLDKSVELDTTQIAAAQGNIPEEIVEIKKDLSEVVPPENTYKRLVRIGNAAQHYNGDIGDNIADCIVSGGGRYSTPIVEGKTYVIAGLTLDPILITNTNDVVIAKYTASPIVTGQNNYMLRFTAPQGSTTAYISGIYDTARAPIIYTLENDNKIVINKGYKKACTASDDTLLSVTNKIIFGEKAKALHCAGTDSITLSMDSAYRSAGLWLNIPYQYFGSERLSSVTVAFKNNDTALRTISISKNSENKEYFNVKDWAFLFMQNIDSNTNTANKVVISWVLENENDSIDIFLYPYIIIDFLFFPTVIFNLEHWDASSGMNRGILSHGLKLVVSGLLPSSDEDIQYAKDCVANGLLEYGFYARENGGDPATVPSLEEGTDMKDMPTYIYDRIQAKIDVTKEQHFYGGGGHTIPAKSAIVGKIHGIDEYRFYNGQGMSIVTNEDSCIMIPTNYLLFYNYYVPNLQGVFSYFDHSGASGNQYDDSTFGVSFTKLKALCDAGFCLNMTPMELKNYKKEFVITEYKELL